MLLAVAVWLVLPARAQRPSEIPSPEQFFGFPMGTDRRLAHWDQMVDYFHTVAEQSDRVEVAELGRTTLGHPYLLATISTPDTLADLPRYRAMQHKLADPRRTTPAEAEAIARTGKAVVLVGANVHATEIGTSQLMNDLIYQLATEQSAWVDHLLDNTIILLIPSENPDGQRMVVDWYRRNLGTPYEGSRLPELYHPYAGHDNNRDSYMLTQVETQYLNRVLYRDWLPEVYLDVHQMGSGYARIFVPPFKDPPNPNVSPLVWSQVNILGQAMAAKLHEADKPGVIWGELYSGFWQGANNTNPWWHNMVSLLTEVASAHIATPVQQDLITPERAGQAPQAGARPNPANANLPLRPPHDVQYRMNYPRPWLGGPWTLGDVVEYGRLAVHGLLESVANNRTTLKRNFYLMNRRTIDRFADGGPYAFLIPAAQRDPVTVAKLIQLLQAEAAQVEVANAPFEADGRMYPAGTYVLRLAQPFGRWVKDILEPQTYPDIRWPTSAAPLDEPYDITAWSLGMLMGVETVQVERPFEASLTPLTTDAEAPPGRVIGEGDVYVLSHDLNQSFTALNRLHTSGATVSWLREAIDLGDGRRYSPGAMVISGVDETVLTPLADDLRLEFVATDLPDGLSMLPIAPPRLGVYEPWGGNMDAGWTRWVLDQHEFSYTQLRSTDVRAHHLYARFDVIILPEMASADLIRGLQGRNVRPEYRGGIGAEGIRNLRLFVEDGGTVIALGNSAAFATEHLSTPVIDVVRDLPQEAFYSPGTILRVAVDTTHPIGYGMPATADAMVVSNGGFRPSQRLGGSSVRTIVRYPEAPLLRSGWIVGDERLRGAGAVLEAPSGKGRVILHTFRVQHRGQTWGTFKLLFNSIFYGPAMSGRPPVQTSLDAQ
ncbi:MAG: M14 metallopeptidase family protein [Vicinamibacterales bacterium]